MTRLKVIVSQNVASFAQKSPKQDLKYTIFFNIKKWVNSQVIIFLAKCFKKAKWQP
jgi:hypothetical protein